MPPSSFVGSGDQAGQVAFCLGFRSGALGPAGGNALARLLARLPSPTTGSVESIAGT
jgi:hypothetical protein